MGGPWSKTQVGIQSDFVVSGGALKRRGAKPRSVRAPTTSSNPATSSDLRSGLPRLGQRSRLGVRSGVACGCVWPSSLPTMCRDSWLHPLFRKDCIVYSQHPSADPSTSCSIGRYSHRVAISNYRLVALADGQVTFRWPDSADHHQQRVMIVSRDESLIRQRLPRRLSALRPVPRT